MKQALLFILIFSFLFTFNELHSRSKIKEKHISFEIISEKTSLSPKGGAVFHIAIKAKMDKGWHIYWHNPGDGGRETKIKVGLTRFFSKVDEFWQVPVVFETAGFATYGYKDEVYFLYKVKLTDKVLVKSGLISLRAEIDYLLCEKVCLPPKKVSLSKAIHLYGDKDNKSWGEVYNKIKENLPVSLSSGIDAIKPSGGDKSVYLSLGSSLSGKKIDKDDKFYFFSKDKGVIKAGDKQELFNKDGNYYLSLKTKKSISSLNGVLVFNSSSTNKDYSLDIKGLDIKEDANFALGSLSPPSLSSSVPPSSSLSEEGISVWLALLLGFLGGIVLNLMPCVFPVLSLKVLNFVEQSGGEKSHIRLHGIIFTIGVLVSFWVLVFFLVSFKELGEIRGWGYQLQNSLVVMILGLFFFVFALNLFGVFEMGLTFSRFGSSGQSAASRSTFFKSFITGVLITISATPCSAPFLGSAIGFTISQSEAVIFLVFTFIALGLSFPYLLLSFFPSLLRFLPRPGSWMESFKQSMGFLLMATLAFLIWVLGKQTSIDTVLSYILSLIIISLGFWVYGRWFKFGSRNVFALIIFFVFLFSGVYLSYSSYKSVDNPQVSSSNIWKSFDIKEIERLKKEGKTVFVDFTAAWCFTCQTNKIALHSKEIEDKFKELGIHTFIADWTKEDKVIGKELNKLGRNAVPVYVFYKGDGDIIFLPDILTKDIILSALSKL